MRIWTADRVQALVEDGAEETLTLEFKAELPGRADRDRAEFLKDVTALANASGGSILYGVAEESGTAASLTGVQSENMDGEIRRLAQILESGVEPRLSGVEIYAVSTSPKVVLSVQVPESFDRPHRYSINGNSRFVQRMGTHVSELSYDQLRSAFDRSSSRINRIETAWEQDLSLQETWKPLLDGPVCVIRLSPLLSADGRQVVDPKRAYEAWSQLIFSGWGGGSSAFNYQGLVVFPGREDTLPTMVQVHRTGAITAYRTGRLLIDNQPLIPSSAVGSFFIEGASKLIDFAKHVGVGGSAILNAGMVRLSGYSFAVRDRYGFDSTVESRRDRVSMPQMWIEDLGNLTTSIDEVMRPGFDLLWQSYGLSECPLFNAEGRWTPPQ